MKIINWNKTDIKYLDPTYIMHFFQFLKIYCVKRLCFFGNTWHVIKFARTM